ncbi:hypothetical protein IW262DRAFT_1514276 [Armillaria fumosa]|nr:hypothetical protein IW262DRAFT_1514276 [Armillaria fumosa]
MAVVIARRELPYPLPPLPPMMTFARCSSVGPSAILKAAGIDFVLDLPGVGQNVQDHTTEWLSFISDAIAYVNLTTFIGDNMTTWISTIRNDYTASESYIPSTDSIILAGYKSTFDVITQIYYPSAHVASNGYTKYRPYPTTAQFAASQEMVSKTTKFLQRELRVWDDLNVEFFTMFMVSLMKFIDTRSESAAMLLAEFLDIDTFGRVMSEHFAQEVCSYVRSPFKYLFVYDSVIQYETPSDVGPPPRPRPRRW